MNKMQHTLLELMRAALIPEDKNNILIHEAEWPELYKLIMDQSMGSILFPIIDSLPDASKPNHEIYDQWKTQLLFSAVSQLRKTQQLKRIVDTLNSVNLPFIIIKGPAIARFYQHPEYRTMGDLDILVEDKYIPLAQQTIESMGYTLMGHKDDHPLHLGYVKQGDLHIELHYALVKSGILDQMKLNNWDEHIWKYRKPILFNGIEFYVMSEEDELINQILHYMRHIIYEGARLKHIYDIALIIQNCGKEFDWNYLKNEMEHLQVLKFGTLIFAIFSEFFNISIPYNLQNETPITPEIFLDQFINYYSMRMGIGTEYKQTWGKLAKTSPFLCKSLVTIPVVYIIDFMMQLKVNKRSVGDSLSITRNNMKLFANTVRTFNNLGLNW